MIGNITASTTLDKIEQIDTLTYKRFCRMKKKIIRKCRSLCKTPALRIVILNLCIFSCLIAQEAWHIAEKTFPSVVLIVMEDAYGQPVSLGSGFFVEEDIITTNTHVIEGGVTGYAKIVGKKTKYDIIGFVGCDTERDLVLLKLYGAMASKLPIGDSRRVVIGEEIYVVGNPQGLEGTFSQGIVSGIRQVDSETILQITAPISPGSSGGPVLNTQGEVIGIAFATFKGGQNLNFAIPANYLERLLFNIKPVGKIVELTRQKQKRSIFDDFGERSIEGIVGENFMWQSKITGGDYSFTLRNRLRASIRDIYCLVIFYDYYDKPLDFDVIYYEGVIPGGLGKRVIGEVDISTRKLTTPVSPDNPYLLSLTPATKLEFRILDFTLLD